MRQPTHGKLRYYGTLLTLIGVIISAAPLGITRAESPTSMIVLDRTLHFTGSDGQDLLVAPGSYRVETQESQLRLTPAEGKDALVVTALPAQHEESVESPVAMVVIEEGSDDQAHIVLLLPGTTALEALGTISGVSTRAAGFSPLNQAQIRKAFTQPRQSAESPNRLQPIKVAPLPPTTLKPIAPTPGSQLRSGPGKWVTWNYLYMRHPHLVAQALAEVQAGTRPLSSLAGLASPIELAEMLKTNWGAVTGQIRTTRSAALAQSRVTTRGLETYKHTVPKIASPPAAPLKPAQGYQAYEPRPVHLGLVPIGNAYSGESRKSTVVLTAPADGSMRVSLNLDATRHRFRIIRAGAYTGEWSQGSPVLAGEVRGGAFADERPLGAGDPTLISMAGLVELPVREGQHVNIDVAFEPDPGHGPPVGNYEALLEIDGVSLSGKRWKRTAMLQASSQGINFKLLAYAEVGHADTLTEQVVEMPILITNPENREQSVTMTAAQLPAGVTMDPQTLAVPPRGSQRQLARFRVSKAAHDGPAQPIVVNVTAYGVTRLVNLSLTIYHPTVFWCFGSCDGHNYVDIPGIDNVINGSNDQRIVEASVWIRDDGNYGWDVTMANYNIVDIGGSTYLATVSFPEGPVSNQLSKNVGPGIETFQFARGHSWIRDNYLLAAERGPVINFCCHDK